MARTFTTLADLRAAVGQDLGSSDWVLVDQARIDTFADATGDHQWIHVDPARAATGPFGSTVAHGYLTLSLVPVLVGSLVNYAGWDVTINYGSNKVRFPSPVRVGSRVRAGATVVDVSEAGVGVQVTLQVSVEVQAHDGAGPSPKPALVAQTLTVLASPRPVGAAPG
ncbi:MAG: MaoC family dehydratase [Nocardioidaceae bacterium]